jgi:hypothetical protein
VQRLVGRPHCAYAGRCDEPEALRATLEEA